MPTFSKAKLSESQSGRGIRVVATSTPGTLIHTAVAGGGDNNYDEIYLFAHNGHTADVVLTIEYGGSTVPNDNNTVTIPWKSGLQLITPGLVLQGGCELRAFASVADVMVLSGFVNKIRP